MKRNRWNQTTNLSNCKGITLIELVLVLALMGVVLSAGFAFFFFGTKTFKNSEIKADNQYDVRMAADFISKEVKYASEVQLLTSKPTAGAGFYDIYLDVGQIKYHKNGVVTTIPGVTGVTDFMLDFSSDDAKELTYIIGKASNSKYNTTTKIVPLNLGDKNIDDKPNANGIRFRIDSVIAAAPIVLASLDTVSDTVPQYTAYTMPTEVDGTATNGNRVKVGVNWNGTIDTTTAGSKSVSGRAKDDNSKTTTLSVTVTPAVIESVSNLTTSVPRGSSYSLPGVLPATITGHPNPMDVPISWSPSGNINTNVPAGTVYNRTGTVVGDGRSVTATVTITGPTIMSVDDITKTVNLGASYSLPTTVSALMSDGVSENKSISWNPSSVVTTTAGVFTFDGTVTGYARVVKATITVKKKLPSPNASISGNGSKKKVVVTGGTPGAGAILRDTNGNSIISKLLNSSGECSFDVHQIAYKDVILNMDGWLDSDPVIPK